MQSKRRAHDAGPPTDQKRKRTNKLALAACNHCRQLKRRCDSGRPACSSCLKTNTVCEYETVSATESRTQAIKRQHETIQASQELVRGSIDWLRTQDQGDALSCLERLRHSADPMDELCSIASTERSRQLLHQIPPAETFLGMTPALNSMLDVELSLSYPSSFPLAFENLPVFQGGLLPDLSTFLEPDNQQGPSGSSHFALPDPWTLDHASRPMLVDARLHNVKMRYWTTVPISDSLAAQLFSTFIQIEISVYGFFDPELLIRDLVGQEMRFCSSLLVDTILFWASCTFGPVYPAASALSDAFLKSAQRLLEAEEASPSDLTVASLAILSISMICFGKDDLAKKYMASCIRMGEEMHLFGSERHDVKQFADLPTREVDMLSFVAWGAFNVSTVYALHFHDLSSGTFTKFPPLLPRPGSQQNPNEPLVPNQTHPTSNFLGESFRSFCQFWCIAHNMAAVYYSSLGPIHEHVPMAFAESKFRSLLKWAGQLPASCSRTDRMSHNVAEMHICYHATTMDVFRPFLSQPQQHLSTFTSSPQRPIAIFALAYNHLKQLTNFYSTTFTNTPAAHTVSWVHGPLYIAPTILRYDKSPTRAREFLACMRACAPLIDSHVVMEGAVKALFSVAVGAGVFGVQEAMAHVWALTAKRAGVGSLDLKTGFVIDQDLAMESRGLAVGDSLIQKLDEMVLFESVEVPE